MTRDEFVSVVRGLQGRKIRSPADVQAETLRLWAAAEDDDELLDAVEADLVQLCALHDQWLAEVADAPPRSVWLSDRQADPSLADYFPDEIATVIHALVKHVSLPPLASGQPTLSSRPARTSRVGSATLSPNSVSSSRR